MSKEIATPNLERHFNVRRNWLSRHESLRLDGDRARETGNPNKAQSTYEETVRRAGVASNNRFVLRTMAVVKGWVSKKMVNPETASWFLDQCNLGYAGEARIETVAATSRLKLVSKEKELEQISWSTKATTAEQKHSRWWDTLERIDQDLHGNPILWTIMIPIDRAVILQATGKNEEAIRAFEASFNQARKILGKAGREPETKVVGAASDGGVARVRQAKLMEETNQIKNYPPETILKFFKQGRDWVHWAGRKSLNYERSRVIEMWYAQYLLATKNYRELVKSLPNWLWLIRHHSGTRRMAKDSLKQVWQKAKKKVPGPKYQYIQD